MFRKGKQKGKEGKPLSLSFPYKAKKEAVPMMVVHDSMESTTVRVVDFNSPEDCKLFTSQINDGNSHQDEKNHFCMDMDSPEQKVHGLAPPVDSEKELHPATPRGSLIPRRSPRLGRTLRFRKGKLAFEPREDDVHPDDDKSSFFARVSTYYSFCYYCYFLRRTPEASFLYPYRYPEMEETNVTQKIFLLVN